MKLRPHNPYEFEMFCWGLFSILIPAICLAGMGVLEFYWIDNPYNIIAALGCWLFSAFYFVVLWLFLSYDRRSRML